MSAIAPALGGLLPPRNQALGVDHSGFSPRVRQKIAHAGVNSPSSQQATRDLAEPSDLDVKPKPVEPPVRAIGRERIDRRDAAVPSHRQPPLMAKDTLAHPERPRPRLAGVSIDGGRIQIGARASRPEPGGHRREAKVAVLETYQSTVQQADPDPHASRRFLDLKRVKEMVRGLGHSLPLGLELEEAKPTGTPGQATGPEGDRRSRPGRPQRRVRGLSAGRECAEEFAPMAHRAAWGRNFLGAAREAFLGDGLAVSWAIRLGHLAPFTPTLDLVDALSYVLAAAFAGGLLGEGVEVDEGWIEAVWSGQVATALTEPGARSAELGSPPPECAESDPRRLVFVSLR